MTEAEMLEELRRLQEKLQEGPDNAFTTREWGNLLGLGEKAVRDRLRMADRAGRLERVRVYREDLRGTRYPVIAYRVKVD